MKRHIASCATLLCILGAAVPASVAAGQAPFTITPIGAYFRPPLFETDYRVSWAHHDGTKVVPIVEWTLKLQIVGGDAGKPSPEAPGSAGAVDLGCSNAGVGIEKPFVTKDVKGRYYNPDTHEISFTGKPAFVWHHPDAADSRPLGRYACNHLEMGPHGHQGLITVTVTANHYRCTATYMGTNTGEGSDRAQRPSGEPTCRTIP